MESPQRSRRMNPIAFTPWPVTLISSAVYLALLIPLLVVHHVLPSTPKSDPTGVSLGEAWRDLQHLTRGFHPYNSRRNDEVHDWLLSRIHEITTSAEGAENAHYTDSGRPDVFVFEDNQSNLTFAAAGVSTQAITGVYFEGTNILVYIRGSEDDTDHWWDKPGGEPKGKGGVLVNAHYDSVSTGFGATDNGMGVVTVLQLLKYFTHPSHYPRKGLVLLLNNGEEDYLNGARVYSQHPLSKFAHTFLNLEGAGAGGRAALFRTTDTEVAKFYENAPHPFGSVLAGDAFELGFLRSQTDYVVFNGIFGLRGLDVAFIEPRARYHTDQDDVRHTSPESLWHMLSAAIGTTEGLVSYTGTEFDGPASDDGKVNSGSGTRGVWFDMFGSSFALFQLHTFFAVSVTLLVVGPLVLFTTGVIVSKKDRMYLFSMHESLPDLDEKISLGGLRGMFRYPFILIASSAIVVGLAYLLTKFNPFIVHSSQYAVWSLMISAWVFTFWFLARIADFWRPSALHRAYCFTWLSIIMWILLVVDTVYQNQRGIAAGYFIPFYFAGTFLATWISYLELFALPRKSDFASQTAQRGSRFLAADDASSRLLAPSSDELPSESNFNESRQSDHADDEEDEPTESTALLRGQQRTTFANYTRTGRSEASPHSTLGRGSSTTTTTTGRGFVFGDEQPWSARLPKWTWLLQFIFLAPIVIIVVGQLALYLTAALHQVGPDGSSIFVVYISIAAFCVLLFIPISPFIHRFTYHIPMTLLLISIGTLIYTLVVFPFSPANRLKVAFFQEVDLDTGRSIVSLTGVNPYVRDVIDSIPSASGHTITCDSDIYPGRGKCSWEGIPPKVANGGDHLSSKRDADDWVSYNITKSESKNQATLELSGKNTRACKLKFDTPIKNYSVRGSATDSRMPHLSPHGVSEIRLWSRTWGNIWTVDIEWDDRSGHGESDSGKDNINDLRGRVVCLWSDDNDTGVIPALDEIRLYAPSWVAITKLQDGLVEASRAFSI